MVEFHKRIRVPVPVAALFAWHERPGAFLRLSPPWDKPEVVSHVGGIRDGARVELRVHAGPVPTTWKLEHRDYIANRQFRDVLLDGPFTSWVHTHGFSPDGDQASVLDDHIAYALPLGGLGQAVAGGFAAGTLARVFAYRHAVTLGDLERHAEYAARPRLRIAITGASGFIGSQLAAFLSTGGHEVLRIGRGAVRPGIVDVSWDPHRGQLDGRALEGVDAVIHLAGASIAERWSETHKRAIRDSRVEGTSLLAHTLAGLSRKPRVLLSGSAIGVYGSCGDERLDERSPFGTDFLADVGRAWEQATAPAQQAGIRVVHLRTGIVQGAAGGALAKQAPLFKLGLGGPLGSGSQWVSPIALDDHIGAMHFCLMRDDIEGPVNLVAPEAVTNDTFTRVLAQVLSRPALAPAPAFALRLALGREMADATVLASQRVVPGVLQAKGFRWRHATLEQMLRFELGVGPGGGA
ncbi:MAG: TIGR01777 family protein [Gemmatimonadaceae bacterium]|nr:TIGR01777 family protein [Gemmatimonadaceae bacterium]